MAEAAAPAKGLGGQLGKKVGPFPLGVWLAAGVGVIWYLRKQQAKTAAPGSTNANPGYGTDPAGNFGLIDPNTGYVAGSASDLAAQQLQGGAAGTAGYGGQGYTSGLGGATGSVDTGAGTGTGATVTTPTGGPSAGGATATGSAASPGATSQGGSTQGTVNHSGTSVTTPGATGTGAGATPTPGPAQPSNKNWRYPAPTGLQAYAISDSGFRLQWQPVQGPNGQKPSSYTTALWQMNGVPVSKQVVGGTASLEYGTGGKGLHPGWQYKVLVWANGGPLAPPGASIVVTVKQKGQA